MANHPEDQLKLLQQRLDRLEDLIQALIQRTHALEKWAFPSSELRSSTGILHTTQVPLSKIEDAGPQELRPTSTGREALPAIKRRPWGDSCVCRPSARVARVNHRRQCFEQDWYGGHPSGDVLFSKVCHREFVDRGNGEGDPWYSFRFGFPGSGERSFREENTAAIRSPSREAESPSSISQYLQPSISTACFPNYPPFSS